MKPYQAASQCATHIFQAQQPDKQLLLLPHSWYNSLPRSVDVCCDEFDISLINPLAPALLLLTTAAAAAAVVTLAEPACAQQCKYCFAAAPLITLTNRCYMPAIVSKVDQTKEHLLPSRWHRGCRAGQNKCLTCNRLCGTTGRGRNSCSPALAAALDLLHLCC